MDNTTKEKSDPIYDEEAESALQSLLGRKEVLKETFHDKTGEERTIRRLYRKPVIDDLLKGGIIIPLRFVLTGLSHMIGLFVRKPDDRNESGNES